ncbi:MAG: HDIG domain-containing protein [Clostridia bacterium]|nr:HDIG domain-containing protein [Clostridia bacterium]
MTESAVNNSSTGKNPARKNKIIGWFRTSAFKCVLMDVVTFALILIIFFLICVPKKYNLSVGSISHDTINATKDVIDEVSTQEKKNAAAALVEPTYRFQQDVKEEVMNALNSTFAELRTIQQYGITLRNENNMRPNSFSEEEIAYAISLLGDLSLNRNQIVTLLRVDNEQFDNMVSTVKTAVDNTMNNSSVREGQVNQAIQTIIQIVGFKVDISLTQNVLPTVLRACIKPNMIIDQEATDEARNKAMESVEPVVYLMGQNIIREGDRVTYSQMEMLRQLGLLNDDHYDFSSYWGSLIAVVISMMTLFIMLLLLRPDVLTNVRQMAVILLILFLCIGLAALTNLLPSIYVMPVALCAALGTVLIGYRVGITLTVTLTLLLAALTAGNNQSSFYDVAIISVMTLSESMFTIWFLKGHPQRTRVLLTGLFSAIIGLVIIFGMKLLTSADSLNTMAIVGWAVGGGILSGFLAVALQPLFEIVFRLPTPTRLLELTNPSQPLMKRLMIEAPGTYHHSIVVANLAESAATRIKANSYLARAGAYYHDIGKLKRPMYFKENQMGENPHEHTDPYVSAAILISHTKDGMLLAQKEHIPPEIQDIILQHHGVTPVMYFYHKALQLSDGQQVDINEFRYTGPKPNTKEAAIVMLADTIEAAVRSMKSPTPKAIDQFIERLVRGKLEDGQLSDSPLSLRDIDEICEAFSDILKGVYHERIEYPNVRHYATGKAEITENKELQPDSAAAQATEDHTKPQEAQATQVNTEAKAEKKEQQEMQQREVQNNDD